MASWKWDDKWGSSPSPSHLISPEENVSNSGMPDLPAEYKKLILKATISPVQQVRAPEPKQQLSELLKTVSLPTNSIGTNILYIGLIKRCTDSI